MSVNPSIDPKFFQVVDAKLNELVGTLGASSVWLVGLSPRGGFTLLRPRGIDPMLVKAYDKGLRHTDPAGWSAVRDNKPTACSLVAMPKDRPDVQLWKDLGLSHLAAAPIQNLLWQGYPGAVVVAKGESAPAFTEAQLQKIKAVADQLAPMYAQRHQNVWRDPTEPVVARRAFVFGEQGWIDADPINHGYSAGFTANIAKSTKNRLKYVGKKPAIKLTNRDLLLDPVSGEYRPVRFGVTEHCAINPDMGPAVFVTLKPSISEWLSIEADDFAAQPDIEQLIPAFRFIAEHYIDGTGIFRIADHVRLSPFHFHRKFTDVMGITPKHFMSECQLRLCKQLMLDPKHSLQDIARLCNFSHQSHFTSRFHQSTGHTPAKWRKRALALAEQVNGHLNVQEIDARTGILRLEEEMLPGK
jgi:AraC-like DNA-binding protein